MHFKKKKTHNSERFRRQKVDRSHRPQLLHPSEVLRPPLSLIFDGERCYPYKWMEISDIYVRYTYGIRRLFPTSSFGLGLSVHDSGVFWITSSLNERIKMGTRVEIAQKYLDIDKVFEKFSLAQKICIAFDRVRDLEGYKILRNKMTRKSSPLLCPFPVSLIGADLPQPFASWFSLFSPPLQVFLFQPNQVVPIECKFRTDARIAATARTGASSVSLISSSSSITSSSNSLSPSAPWLG